MTANIFNGECLNGFPLWSGARQEYLLLSLVFSIALDVLAEKKEINSIHVGKEVMPSLFVDDVIFLIYKILRNPHIQKLLGLINEVTKVSGYKINR